MNFFLHLLVGLFFLTSQTVDAAPAAATVRKYNVCSFDGGGFRGVGTAVILAVLEMNTGKPIYEICDVLVGSSTGALIAVMAAEGKNADEILEFYIKEGPLLFQKTFSQKLRSVLGLVGTSYSADPLENLLGKNLTSENLTDIKKPVGLLAHNTTTGTTEVLSNYKPEGSGSQFSTIEAARAATAAPTYFPGVDKGGEIWVDGGISINDPSTIAYLDTKNLFPAGAAVRVLSFGTGTAAESGLSKNASLLNIVQILKTIVKASTQQSQQALMKILESQSSNNLEYVRIQFELPKTYDMADTRKKVISSLMTAAYNRSLQPDFVALKNAIDAEMRLPRISQ